jgi:flagellar protein FlaG
METESVKSFINEVRTKKQLQETRGQPQQGKAIEEIARTTDAAEHKQPLTGIQAEAIAQRVNDFLESVETDLRVEIHKETHKAMFRIVRKQDQKVIQEVPPRSMLDIEANINKMAGSLININA